MSLSKLPSGRWRAQIHHDGKNVSVPKIIGGPKSYGSKREARAAREKARLILAGRGSLSVTVREFWERWTTDRLFERPKASTDRHNRERTKEFVRRYGSLQIAFVDDRIVGDWLAGGNRNGHVPALRAMFNDAMSAKAGRLVDRNPFAKLGIARRRGNQDAKPPSPEVVRELIAAAERVASPSFAAWLKVAAYTGMRPGELDALRWENLDFERSRIIVLEQFSASTRTFTTPKNGKRREAPMTPPAREAFLTTPRESAFCFVNLRGEHWTAASRAYHWKAVRAAVGYEGTLYLATRHHAGDYMTNDLGLPAEDVAIALGHTDGGYLVRTLYGHRDEQRALDRVIAAYEARQNVVPLRAVDQETA